MLRREALLLSQSLFLHRRINPATSNYSAHP